MTAVPISIRLVRAPIAASSGNGRGELPREVVDAEVGAVRAELLGRDRQLDRLQQRVRRRSHLPSAATTSNGRTTGTRCASRRPILSAAGRTDRDARLGHDEDRPRPGAQRPRRHALAAGRRAGRRDPIHSVGWTWRRRARGWCWRIRGGRTTRCSSGSRSPPWTSTWPAACASRRWPRWSRATRRRTRTTRRSSTRDDLDVRAAHPAAAQPARLLCLRGPRPDHVGAARRDGAGGVVSAADLLLRQRLRDPRAGRAGLVPRRLAGARLRAGGGGADRHAGARPGRGARRGGDRRVPGLQ